MINRLLQILSRGPLTTGQIREHLKVSQPTVSRLMRSAGSRIVRIGRGRATQYATTGRAFGGAVAHPLYAVNEQGVVEEIGTLHSLTNGHFLMSPSVKSFWLQGHSRTGYFESFPYYLDDLRPSGFIGRQIARQWSRERGFPDDARLWSSQQLGEYFIQSGHDLPGNLVLGMNAAHRALAAEGRVVKDREKDYPFFASQAMSEGLPASSAAGEQPKFCIHHHDAGHVIVKFSPSGDSPEALRWRDLLIAEHHALRVLGRHAVRVSEASIYVASGRVFLESQRFDRIGHSGRQPAISLAMVDAEFVGLGERWTQVAHHLHQIKLLDAQSMHEIVWAETFGEWIGNTDMHLGNLSVTPGEDQFRLLPVYDMLPMAFAPVRGELPSVVLRPPVRTQANRDIWIEAGAAAAEFWQELAEDEQITQEFRQQARTQSRRCGQATSDLLS